MAGEMNVARSIDEASGLVSFTVKGTVTYEGIVRALSDMMDDPRFRKAASNLWDFREASSGALSGNEIERFAVFVDRSRERRGEGYKVAFVVSGDAEFGLARMYEGHAERLPFKIMVFRDLDAASRWIRD